MADGQLRVMLSFGHQQTTRTLHKGESTVSIPEDPHPHPFPTTRWTMVGRAGDPDATANREALSQLIQIYLPALRVHLVRAKRIDPTEAEDLVQSFISAKFLETNLVAQADRTHGRFRTFVLTCLDRFVISERRKAAALKRGGGGASSLDAAEVDVPDTAQVEPSHEFDVAWARELLLEVTRRMRAECEKTARPEVWGVFECRILQPILDEAEPVDYAELVQRFSLQSPVQASNVLVTGKRMFERLLRAAVSAYATTAEEIEEEIRDLRTILERGSTGH